MILTFLCAVWLAAAPSYPMRDVRRALEQPPSGKLLGSDGRIFRP